MSSSVARFLIPFIVVALVSIPSLAAAADTSSVDSHVRTDEREIAMLLDKALASSPFFRSLVEHLTASDVIVYVRSSRDLPSHVEGNLTFMAAAGGRRYVVVSVAWGRSSLRTIATMGHELQHAIEIAERPAIVDAGTLADAYDDFGTRYRWKSHGHSYETAAAARAGARVWAEMNGLQNVAR